MKKIVIDIVEKRASQWRIIGMGPDGQFEALHVTRGRNAKVRNALTDEILASGRSLAEVLQVLAHVSGYTVELCDDTRQGVLATYTPRWPVA